MQLMQSSTSDPHVVLTWLLSLIIFLPAVGALVLCLVPRRTDEAIRRFSLLITRASCSC